MKRLHCVNGIGVRALTALCVLQWERDRQLNLEVNRIEKVRLDQAAKLDEQQHTIIGLNADLAHFKEQFVKSGMELNDVRQKLRTAEREAHHLEIELPRSLVYSAEMGAVARCDPRFTRRMFTPGK
jgi:hypothetical protein